MTEWRVFVRSAALATVAEVSDFAHFEYTKRRNAAGTWALDLNADLATANLLGADDPGVGLLVYADDIQVMSGEVRDSTLNQGGSAGGNLLEVRGIDDTGMLAERLASPDPAGPPYDTEGDVRTGQLSTILRQYADNNAGPSAIADRRISGLVLAADPATGATVTGRAMWQNLLDFLAELALNSDLRFHVRQHATNAQREFVVAAATDRADSVRFALDLGNLAAVSRTRAWPTATFIVAGGQGQGATRLYAEDNFAPGDPTRQRVEAFLDLGSVRFSDELNQAIDEELAKNRANTVYELEPIDTEATQYPRDYELGDTVTAIVDDVAIEATVAEAVIRAEGGTGRGWSVRPALQTAAGSLVRIGDRPG